MTITKSPYRSLFQLGGLALGSVLVIFGLKWFTYADGRTGSKSPSADKPKLSAKPITPVIPARACGKVQITHSVMINRPAKDLFSFWRKWENLPEFMKQIQTVSMLSETKMFWIKQSPSGKFTTGETNLVEEENKSLGGQSKGLGCIGEGGLVQLVPAPNGRSTRMNVIMEYERADSGVGASLASVSGELRDDPIRDDLRWFKHLMETNEIPVTQNQASVR